MFAATVYHTDPFIALYEQAVSPPDCEQIIALARDGLQPSKVVGPAGLTVSNVRKSENTWFEHQATPLINQVSKVIASIVGHPLHFADRLQVTRYPKGGKFTPHFDSYDLSSSIGKSYFHEGGQRLSTAILYLNNVAKGGETAFPLLKLSVVPQQGSVLIFENCKRGTTRTHPLSLHEGRPVKRGEKWIATLWFREKAQY